MKVFVSSVIRGLEDCRDAAARAARTLRHEVKRAEDFPASPATPQQACLAGVRWADVVVLILGGRYGERQASGLSPTHEEYREARGSRAVLVFVQRGAPREPEQEALIAEARGWATGTYTADFRTPEELGEAAIRALHELELTRATGPVDQHEILSRGRELLPRHHDSFTAPMLTLVVAGGPRQQILRPSELGRRELGQAIAREALFGEFALLDQALGFEAAIRDDALRIEQQGASIRLDQLGEVLITQPARRRRPRGMSDVGALIEEDVQERLHQGLRFAGWILDHVDSVRRLSHVVVIVRLDGGLGWRTRAEDAQNPGSLQLRTSNEPIIVELDPPLRHRAVLTHEAIILAEDFTVVLGRRMRA